MRVARSLVLLSLVALATVPAEGQRAPSFRVDTWSSEEGLPSSALTGLVQTSDGYLWLAAGGSLVSFDGFEFQAFNQATNPDLPDRVNHLYAGIGDTIWLGLDDGTVAFRANGRFVVLDGFPSFGFLQGAAGELLALNSDGAYRWNQQKFELVEVPEGWQWALHRRGVGRDAAGDAWFVGLDGTMLRLSGSTAERRGFTASPFLVMRPSRGEVLQVHYSGSVAHVVDSAATIIVSYRRGEDIRPFLVDRRDRLWVVMGREVLVYMPGQLDPIARFGASNFPTGVMEDRAGNIWFQGDGLTRVQEVPFRTVTSAPGLQGTSRQLRSLSRGPDGSVVADAHGDSVVFMFAGDSVVRLAPGFMSASTDTRGTTWALRIGSGELTGRHAGLPDLVMPRRSRIPNVMAADPSQPGFVWFAGNGILYRADPYGADTPRVVDSVTVPGIPRMALAPDGTLWAMGVDSTMGPVLIRYAAGVVTRWTRSDGLPSAQVRDIHVDATDGVWLGLYGGGLVRFASGKFSSITAEHGLADNVASCILEDEAGNFWMAGNRGVHRVRRDEAIAFVEGRVPRVHGVLYARRDGLTDPETNAEDCVRRDDGTLWFPTFGGAGVVDPSHAIALDSVPPLPHVLGIRTIGDTLLPASITRIPKGQRRLAFSYTAVALRHPAGTRFEYRLDGVDQDWIHAGAGRVATYNDVGRGSHTFRVRAVNAGGTRSTADATFTFTIPPYFHETIPFYLLVAGMLAFTGHLVWRARTAQLLHRQAELQTMVASRTSELANTLSVVEQQATQLRSLDEAKSRFFANVSHEFRTPLSLIMGPLEDLRDGRSGALNDAARRKLGTILANSRRLSQLVEQLLDVARLESGTLALRAEVRDVEPQLRRIAESFASMAERRAIDFRVSMPAGGLRVRHDPDQMEKVAGNLLGNALKFTPEGGRVELRASRDGDWVVLEVEDTGPGIAPEHQARVFERFFQVDDSTRRAHEGAGIGLALARELVDLHGGTLTLRSVVGEGSTFTVRLPLAADGASTAELTLPVRHPNEPATRIVRDEGVAVDVAAAEDDAEDVTTVLVVEDNEELLEYLADHLRDQYRVMTATNGVRALELVRERIPDLVVSDVMMPELDGQSLCGMIKGDPETDFIPVILLTAKASRDSRIAGLEGGADDYLAKPVDMRELLARAANLITSRRRLRERWQDERRALPTLPPPPALAPPDAGSEAFVRKLYAAMAANIADEAFNVDALAAAVDVSRSTLYRRLESLTGQSPMDLVMDYRLQQAAQWLAETDANVSEIAYGVGFKSVPHFCSRFRERFGASPSAYRRTK